MKVEFAIVLLLWVVATNDVMLASVKKIEKVRLLAGGRINICPNRERAGEHREGNFDFTRLRAVTIPKVIQHFRMDCSLMMMGGEIMHLHRAKISLMGMSQMLIC